MEHRGSPDMGASRGDAGPLRRNPAVRSDVTGGRMAQALNHRNRAIGRPRGNKAVTNNGEAAGPDGECGKAAAQRTRQRSRELVREEIAPAESRPAESDEGIRYVMGVISG